MSHKHQQQVLLLQEEEIEAIKDIYLDDFELLKNSAPYKVAILCKPFLPYNHDFADIDDSHFNLKIIFEMSSNYP